MLPFGQTGDALDVQRRDDLPVQNLRLEAGREALDRVHHGVAERFALGVGPAAVQLVRRILHEDRHHVLSGRRHPRIDHRREHDVHVGTARELAVLRVVVRALDILEARADRYRAAMQLAAGPPSGMQVNVGSESSARFTLPDEPRNLKRSMSATKSSGRSSASSSCRNVRRGSRLDDDRAARDLVAVLQHDAGGFAAS